MKYKFTLVITRVFFIFTAETRVIQHFKNDNANKIS